MFYISVRMSNFVNLRIVVLATSLALLLLYVDGKILRLNQCGKFDANFSVVMKNKRLNTEPIERKHNVNLQKCIGLCVLYEQCESINFREDVGTCELLKETTETKKSVLEDNNVWVHYETNPLNNKVGEVCEELSPCPLHYCEDMCEPPGYKCNCSLNKYTGEHCEVFHGNVEGEQLARNNLIGILPKLRKSWFLSIDIKPVGVIVGWSSIVHATIEKNYGTHGDRTPSIFFYGNSTKLHISSAINDNHGYVTTSEPLPLNQFTTVMISQRKRGNEYIFSININGSNVHEVINKDPREYNDVKLFVADPWHNPGNAFIRSLQYGNYL